VAGRSAVGSIAFQYATDATWVHTLVQREFAYTHVDEARAVAEGLVRDGGYAMSANLDLVRSICAGGNAAGTARLTGCTPKIELVIEDLPPARSWKGVAAVAQAWQDFLDAWEGHRIEVEEFRRAHAISDLGLEE
jgi:hypothetical protein